MIAAALLVAPLAWGHELRCDKKVRACPVVEECVPCEGVGCTTECAPAVASIAQPECSLFQPFIRIASYPVDVEYAYEIANVHPTRTSAIGTVKEQYLDLDVLTLPWELKEADDTTTAVEDIEGLALPVGAYARTTTGKIRIGSYQECLALANSTPPCGYAEPQEIAASVIPVPVCEGTDVECRRCYFRYPEGTAFIDDRLLVEFERGQAQCTARVICLPDGPVQE